MAWLFEKSRTWRVIVAVTKQNTAAMVGFSAVCCAVPYYLGKLTMGATNPEVESEHEKHLRGKASLHQKASLLATGSPSPRGHISPLRAQSLSGYQLMPLPALMFAFALAGHVTREPGKACSSPRRNA